MLQKKKSIAALCLLLLAQQASAFRGLSPPKGHPFHGENSDKSFVERQGGSSHRAEPIPATSSKYASLKSQVNYRKEEPLLNQAWSFIFGSSQDSHSHSILASSKVNGKSLRLRQGEGSFAVQSDRATQTLFTTNFNVGGLQRMDFIIDSATDFIAVQSVDCETCSSGRYDISYNLNRQRARVDQFQTELEHSRKTWMGRWAEENFCWGVGRCFKLDIYLIDDGAYFEEPADGVVGLAKGEYPFMLAPDEQPRNEYFYLTRLDLTVPQFSTHFQKTYIPWVDFGDMSPEESELEGLRIESFNDHFWSFGSRGVRFGTRREEVLKFSVGEFGSFLGNLTDVYTILDSGEPSILVSDLWYEQLMARLFEIVEAEYVIEEGVTYATCNAPYPDIYFDVSGLWVQVMSEDYVIDISEDGTGESCMLNIKGLDAPFNILGMPAYADYYITHNWGENFCEFRKSQYSFKRRLEFVGDEFDLLDVAELEVELRSRNFENGAQKAWQYALLVSGVLCTYWWLVTWYAYVGYVNYEGGTPDYTRWLIYGFIGTVASFWVFWGIRLLLLNWFLPGNEIEKVESAENVIEGVHAAGFTVFGYLNYRIHSLINSRKQKQQQSEQIKLEDSAKQILVLE